MGKSPRVLRGGALGRVRAPRRASGLERLPRAGRRPLPRRGGRAALLPGSDRAREPRRLALQPRPDPFIASPLGDVYRLLIPRFVRDRGRDFAANLLWPRNLVANLLQAKWRAAGTETARFGINTTVGIAGLWDPATRWWSIAAAAGGLRPGLRRPGAGGPSTFLVLPVYGPSTVRDAIGLVPDTLSTPPPTTSRRATC